MSRYKPLIERKDTDKKELDKIIQNPLADPDLIARAKAILLFLNGSKGDAIAREMGVRPNTVSDWRKRYEEGGIEGLYDRAPKGRRGSETRDKVLEMMEQAPPEGGWTTKALADAVGTSLDTVRRALRGQHKTISRAYVWDAEIKRTPAKVCLDAIGLYMSKGEAGLIIQINPQFDRHSDPRSFVTTANRNLARSWNKIEQTENGMSIEDAINASIEEMKEVARGEKESFQDFLNKVIKENCNQTSKNGNENTRQYYILYWQDKKNAIKPILQHSGVIVEKTEGAMQWLQKIEPWIEIMSHSFSDHEESGARSLISSISLYLSRTTTQVEPFEWWRLSA